MTLDKTSALKSLLVVAWRQRMTDLQFSIKLKEILPRGCTGDVYGLSGLILNAALLSPQTPNQLLLGYLDHALATQTVSHAAVLQAVASFHDQAGKKGPFCLQALLNFAQLSLGHVTARGKPEECLNLSVSILKIMHWLLKILLQGIVAETTTNAQTSAVSAASQRTEAKNLQRAKALAHFLLDNEFTMCMMYIGRLEDKDTFTKVVATCKRVTEQLKSMTQQHGGMASSERTKFKQEVTRLVTFASGSLDPLSIPSMEFMDGGGLGSQKVTSAQVFLSKSHHVSTVVHVIQPLLMFEAVLKPTSDLNALAQSLAVVAGTHNVSFSNLVYEILRALLVSVSQKHGLETLKVDAFIMIKLPLLLQKLHNFFRGSEGPPPPLKTPTDTYKAFDKLLKNENFLDAKDSLSKCNVLHILLMVVGKCPVPLLTDTEREDILKRRTTAIANARIKADTFSEEFVGPRRNFDNVLKAESKDILSNMLKAVDQLDLNKNPESIEHLLDILCNIVATENFNLLLVTSAALTTSANNKLKAFVKVLFKFNQVSQESQGESVKNSLLRCALFDITFLMIVYIVQCFGPDLVMSSIKDSLPPNSSLKQTFVYSWLIDMWIGCGNKGGDPNLADSISKGKVDNLLQQLQNGDLRTQVVKWQDICSNAHSAMKEVLNAKAQGLITNDKYQSIVNTMCSRVGSLPVCVMVWLTRQADVPPRELPNIAKGLAAAAEKFLGQGQHAKERIILTSTIMNKMMVEAGLKQDKAASTEMEEAKAEGRVRAAMVLAEACTSKADSLKEVMQSVWSEDVCSGNGRLTSETIWQLRSLYRVGGASWYVGVLVEELLVKTVYHAELDKLSDLVVSLFHVDIEQCALALLLDVLPAYLQGQYKRERLADPHGTALANLLIGTVCSALAAVDFQSNTAKPGMKRTRTGQSTLAIDEDINGGVEQEFLPSNAKIRRLFSDLPGGASSCSDAFTGDRSVGGSAGVTDSSDSKKSTTEENPTVQRALWSFFKLLQSVVTHQTCEVTPVTHFAFRVLEQAALKAGLQVCGTSVVGAGAKATAGQQPPPRVATEPLKHFLQHVSLNLVLHLVKVVPDLFTSLGVVTKLFDVVGQGQQARKNAARTLCLLRNITGRKSAAAAIKRFPATVVSNGTHNTQASNFTIKPHQAPAGFSAFGFAA